MSRVLFVVPPLVGHLNPTVALGQALLARGHEVAWVGYEAALRGRLPDGAASLALGHGMDDSALQALQARGMGLRGAAAFKFLWEELFFPLAREMQPGVLEAVRSWEPDVLVHDQQTYAGALVARQVGLPWVTSAGTSANLVDPFDSLPQLRTWWHDGLLALQRDAGLEASPEGLLSPHAVLAWSTPALIGPTSAPAHWHLVGPPITRRPGTIPFPWERLDASRPAVLVTLGTVNPDVGERFFHEAAQAVTSLGLQAVLVAPDGMLADPHPDLIVQAYVPQLELLSRVHAVVCHAGHNTVVESLAHGLPLVVAPIRDDQPVVAQQVVDAGAGLRVKFGRVRADRLAEALRTVLDEPAYRQAATRIQRSFETAGGVQAAADVVEGLVASAR